MGCLLDRAFTRGCGSLSAPETLQEDEESGEQEFHELTCDEVEVLYNVLRVYKEDVPGADKLIADWEDMEV